MDKIKLVMPVLVGLVAGQIFAESERPFKVVNTLRVGASDNLYRAADDEETEMFVTDTVDLSFKAALSDRTDLVAKSQFNLINDQADTDLYPNLYVMLNHSVSPRLLLGVTELYRSGGKYGGDVNKSGDEKYDYYYNKVAGSADYILTEKDRLQGSVDYAILRHDEEIEDLDYTQIGGGATWKRTLIPQRTFATLNVRQSNLEYDNRPQDSIARSANQTNTLTYLDDEANYDETDLFVGLNHTINQNWQGYIDLGVSYIRPNFSDSTLTVAKTNGTTVTTNPADNDETLSPLIRAGLAYTPSPRTRLSSDIEYSYQPSDDSGYGGSDTAQLTLAAQHEITAKLMAKATARLADVQYGQQDSSTGRASDEQEQRMDLELRLTYKLSRINFLEAGVAHRETDRDIGDDWTENRVDVGWRIELN